MAAASAAGQHNGTHHAARRLRLNLDGGLANLLEVLGEKVVGELANVLVHSACLAHGACLNAAQHSTHAHTSERDLPPRAAARRAASQAAMLVLRPPGGHCCLSVRRRASISQAGTSAKRVRASTHKMQKVMSRDCESRQTEVNLEHEIAVRGEASLRPPSVTIGVSPKSK
jgi:hypothetical protein